MSQYYNPNRGASWNYGGKNWKLSRSKIDLFLECPRCFYIDNKLGTKRPPGFPFNLNSAVDYLLKKEFDIYRATDTKHPLMEKYGIDAVPYAHKELNEWRENFKGVRYYHKPTKITVSGAIDDLWKDNRTGEIIVVDYKATSKDEKVTIDAPWQISYKRQMEVYQWLLRGNGLIVSDTGYFVYANGKKDVKAFDAKLEFDIVILPYTGNADWIPKVLHDIHACLNDARVPVSEAECDYCMYRETIEKTLHTLQKVRQNATQTQKTEKKNKKEVDKVTSSTLF